MADIQVWKDGDDGIEADETRAFHGFGKPGYSSVSGSADGALCCMYALLK